MVSPAELAETASLRGAWDWIRRERAWIHDRHLKLCRIPAPTFFEQKRAEWMASELRALGWHARLDRAGNVVASLNGRRERSYVALTAHLDTVLAPRAGEEIRIGDDGRLMGPGVSDNGAGLAALLAIAAVWKAAAPFDDDLPLEPLLVANVGEEGEGNLSGMRFLCRPTGIGSRIKSFLVLDGPNLDHITCQALASRRFDVSCNGPGGHSWSDSGVANPVHALSRAITLFADNAPNGTGPRSSFNFGVVEGGSSVNSIPSTARAKVDLRSESPDRIDQMAGLLEQSLARAVETENLRASAAKITARLREIGSRPGGKLQPGSEILEIMRAIDAHLGISSRLDCASTDANIPLSMGIPAVSIGVGGQGGGAHTRSEWFHPEGREIGLRRILLAMGLLLSEGRA
jgi:di/tripeptidase